MKYFTRSPLERMMMQPPIAQAACSQKPPLLWLQTAERKLWMCFALLSGCGADAAPVKG
jgi:hypothetical protein